jgi:hypothetical protein
MRTLVHWIEAGAQRGDGPDPLKEHPTLADTWSLGTPDHVVDIPRQEVAATGVLDYRYEKVELDIDRDVYVESVEVLPGVRSVLHHVLVSVSYPEGFEPPMEQRDRWIDGTLAAYAPGAEAEVFPTGTGRFLPNGSSLEFQLHYTTTGRAEVDESKLGLWFTDAEPEREYLVSGPVNSEFEIPPGAKAYETTAEQVFEEPITLYGMFPHMHFRGKSFSYEAHYPDGRVDTLLSIPNYNFNWQRNYLLAEPVALPAGTRIVGRAVFDNSALNPYNPAPADTVRWGDQTFEEMMIGFMSFHYGHPGTDVLHPVARPAATDQAAQREAGHAHAGAAIEPVRLP